MNTLKNKIYNISFLLISCGLFMSCYNNVNATQVDDRMYRDKPQITSEASYCNPSYVMVTSGFWYQKPDGNWIFVSAAPIPSPMTLRSDENNLSIEEILGNKVTKATLEAGGFWERDGSGSWIYIAAAPNPVPVSLRADNNNISTRTLDGITITNVVSLADADLLAEFFRSKYRPCICIKLML